MKPPLISTIPEVRNLLAGIRNKETIGCVPTMGALHAGHGALMDRARTECDFVIATVFVNPIQFNRAEDLASYPRPLDDDLAFCGARRIDAVFAPSEKEMYPEPIATSVDVARLTDHLCGHYRPGHFQGVATVVMKLFGIIQPDRAYFGEKDAQQLAVIRRMVRDLNVPVEVVGVETVREPTGLAISSRNQHLDEAGRRSAPAIYRALTAARDAFHSGEHEAVNIKRAAVAVLAAEAAIRVEYLEVVDPDMQPVEQVTGPARIATAVWIGDTRLIDNIRLP